MMVDKFDSHEQPLYNGVVSSAGSPPGTGTLHRARIEDGQVVEVECGTRAKEWTPFTAKSAPQRCRECCARCGHLSRVPGVERTEGRSFRVDLTEEYDPEETAPVPLDPQSDGGDSL